MTRPCDTCNLNPSDLMTDGLTTDDPPQKKWRLEYEDYRAARRALYAARAQIS